MSLIEAALLTSLFLWGVFYLINHADLFAKLRVAVMPALPRWLAYPIQCAFCSGAWVLAAFSLFTGWTPLVLYVPTCMLFIELTYKRLAGKGGAE